MGRTKKFWNEVVASGVCLAVLFCIPLPLLADTPKAINDQTATGDRPFANFMSADIDQVQINSGALDVRIPLVYRKGRRLDFDPFWLYTNKVWMVQAIPTGLPRPNDYQRFWTTVDQQEVTFVLEERTFGAVGPYNVATKFVYTDRFGTKHPFDGQKAYAVQACDLDQLTGHSLDATGMTLTIPSNFDPAGGSASLVREKDGTQVNVNSAVGVWREDSNGNFISISSLSQSETDRVDTLGRTVRTVTGQLADGTKYNDWIVRDSNGVVQTTRVEFIDVAVQTNFQLPQVSEYFGSLFGLAKRIILPNGLTYRFTYDGGAYGDLLRVDLPTGGYIRYEHQTILADRSTSRGVAKRIVSVDGNPTNEKTWTYGPHLGNGLPGQFTITVTDPDGNDSVHTFLDFVNNSSYEIKVQFYQGSASAGTLLKIVQTDYTSTQFPIADVRPIRVTTTLPNGLTSKVETDYDSAPDSNGVIAGSRANPSERREYTYGSGAAGPLARRTTFTYLHNSNSAYANANLVSLVSNQITYDGSGSLVAQTSFGYDTTPIAITSGVVQHDYTNYPYTNPVRGNRTTISRWRNTDGAWLTTTNWFDDLGNLKQTQDPLTHNTFIDYTDSWGTQSGASACAPSGGSAQAFVTKITNHLGQIARSSYYSCSSRGATTTDLNSQTTTFSYDLMDRRTQVNLPDGGQTSVCYSEIQGSSCYSAPPPLKVVTTTKVDSTKNLVAAAVYDGLGRVSQAQLNSDPQGITYTDTTYDNLGRKATVSNPY